MCGIAGIYSNEGFIDNNKMEFMGIEMQNRGFQSTGFIACDEFGRVTVKKDILKAEDFFVKHPLKKRYKWMFVHTRAASCGKVSVENAHPFVCENIIGLQNGFCHDHITTAQEYGLPLRECDSNTLFDLVNLLGEPLNFADLWTGVIVYYDKTSDQIEIRGSKMSLPFSLAGEEVAFASTNHCLINAGYRVNWQEEGIKQLTLKG